MAFRRSLICRLADMCTTVLPSPSVSRSLSKEVIAEQVRGRVLERDSWVPDETKPDPKELMPYWREMLFPSIPSQQELDASFPVKIQCTWIGHSTMLVQMKGINILTDPVFSDRCSPSQWFGPKRFRKPSCSIQELKNKGIDIDIVLLSHNHYDHLDYESMRELAITNENNNSDSSPPLFVVPLGLKVWFDQNISKNIEIVEMDWHESIQLETLSITSVPMRHWSSRMGYDRDMTLWCGYVVEEVRQTSPTPPPPVGGSGDSTAPTNETLKFLFPGDTAWFDGLYEIGTKYGPFDLAGIPIGAYAPWDFMKVYHVDPPNAVKMMKAIQAKKAVPIHFGTFVLTFEPVLEPIEWLERINHGIDFRRWNIGDTVTS
jgi:N-acyl-phosphatidylethanolamine-hydrolysing phospholipase D